MKKTSKPRGKKKKPKLSDSSSGIAELKRNILWRPERHPYLTSKHENKACVFCEASSAGVTFESLVVWASLKTQILLNKYPYNNGHLLVVPRRHLAELDDLDSDEFLELHQSIKKSIYALRQAAVKGPAGFNVGLNLGSAAGAGLPGHLHYHVVPRWVGDSNFFPLIGQTKVISETLEQTYARLLPWF